MTGWHDPDRTLPWLRDGTTRLLATADLVDDAGLRGPSTLPGWTRAHVLGHVARNADALCRLADWARTGVETPMYRDREQRAAEIESSAAQPAAAVRHDVVATAERLAGKLEALEVADWKAQVRTAAGRPVPATEIPWLRVREVWLHAVDLAAGFELAGLPDDLVDALLDEVTEMLSARPGCPDVRLAADDRDRAWRLGADAGAGPELSGPAALLLGWVTGRETPPGDVRFPAWL